MELNDFVKKFADVFEDTDATEIQPNTEYHNLDEWSSLTLLGIIAMVKINYGKEVTGKEIREADTVEDLFNLIASK